LYNIQYEREYEQESEHEREQESEHEREQESEHEREQESEHEREQEHYALYAMFEFVWGWCNGFTSTITICGWFSEVSAAELDYFFAWSGFVDCPKCEYRGSQL
jgi:ABC-type Zn2+ transport system substrate-binding protein/surface adhesin